MYYIYSISTTYYFNYLSLFDIFLIIYFVIWYLDLISGSVPTYSIVNNFFQKFPCNRNSLLLFFVPNES